MLNIAQHNQICFSVEFTYDFSNCSDSEDRELGQWMEQLIKELGMETITPPELYYVTTKKNEGWAGTCNYQTSHLVIHIWNKPAKKCLHNANAKLMKGDLYLCGKVDQDTINVFLNSIKWMKPVFCEYMIINRDVGLEVVDKQSVKWPL